MNKLNLLAVVAVAAAAFGTAGVLGQSNADFTRADGNNDGKITRLEAQGAIPTLSQELFDKADVNHDGVLDETEWPLAQALSPEQGNSHDSSEAPPSEAPAPSSSSVPD